MEYARQNPKWIMMYISTSLAATTMGSLYDMYSRMDSILFLSIPF